MTTLLREAFQKASALPEDVQQLLAKELIEEIEWETHWDQTLADSQPLLDRLTARAMQEFREGKTEEKGFDEL